MWIVLGIKINVFVDLGGITAISKSMAVDVDLHGISPHYFFQAERTRFQKDLSICEAPRHRPGLPGNVISFILYPLPPPTARGLRGTFRPRF